MFELTISDNKVTKKHVAYVNCKIENQNCFFFCLFSNNRSIILFKWTEKKKIQSPWDIVVKWDLLIQK